MSVKEQRASYLNTFLLKLLTEHPTAQVTSFWPPTDYVGEVELLGVAIDKELNKIKLEFNF